MNPPGKHYEEIILPRHTYSEANAKRFKEVFDKALENKTNEFISCEAAGLKLNSLKQRCNEAFLWLVNNSIKDSKYTKEDYKNLRNSVKVKPVSYGGKEGVLIYWFTTSQGSDGSKINPKRINSISTKSNINEISSNNQSQSGYIHWKERIIKFIENDKMKSLIMDEPQADFQGKLLTDIDVEWITKTFTSAGIEFEVGPCKIIAAK